MPTILVDYPIPYVPKLQGRHGVGHSQTSVLFEMVATRFDDYCETKGLLPEEQFPLVSLNHGHNVRPVEVITLTEARVSLFLCFIEHKLPSAHRSIILRV